MVIKFTPQFQISKFSCELRSRYNSQLWRGENVSHIPHGRCVWTAIHSITPRYTYSDMRTKAFFSTGGKNGK